MGCQWHQMDHMQISDTSLQTDNHASISSFFTGQMLFLMPNQQCQTTEGTTQYHKLYRIKLLGDRGTRGWTTCLELLSSRALTGRQTCNLFIASPMPTDCAITPAIYYYHWTPRLGLCCASHFNYACIRKKIITATNNRKHYDYTLLEITCNNFSNMW